MRPEIWWADIVRAGNRLGTEPSERFFAIARALGFGSRESPADENVSFTDADRLGVSLPHPRVKTESTTSAPAPSATANRLGTLEPTGVVQLTSPLTEGSTLPRPSDSQTRAVQHRSLLAPRSANAILDYLIAVQIAEGLPDVAPVVDAIASGRAVTGVPRSTRRTLRYGVQVLVDLSEGMRPFCDDENQVVEQVRALVGRESTDVKYFIGTPLRGAGSGPESTWQGYSPPAFGMGVLLLTDFGVGGDRLTLKHGSQEEWVRFFDRLRRQRCQAVALVPYPAHRWPNAVRLHCRMLTWDRNVTAGHARSAML